MATSCIVEIEDAPDDQRKNYNFAEIPRVGEIVVMDWDGERYPGHMVYGIRHIPDGVEDDRPGYTVIYLRRTVS